MRQWISKQTSKVDIAIFTNLAGVLSAYLSKIKISKKKIKKGKYDTESN